MIAFGGVAMASLTIRNLDDDLKSKLRLRAAEHGRSMEAEVREILAETLNPPTLRQNLVTVIRNRFESVLTESLPIPPRQKHRPPPDFEE